MGDRTYTVSQPQSVSRSQSSVSRNNIDRFSGTGNPFPPSGPGRSVSSQSLSSRASSASQSSGQSVPSQVTPKPQRMYPNLRQQLGVGIASSAASSGMFLIGSETIHELREVAGDPYYEQVTLPPTTEDPFLAQLLKTDPSRHYQGTDFNWSTFSEAEAHHALQLELGMSTTAPEASNPFDGLEVATPASLGRKVGFDDSKIPNSTSLVLDNPFILSDNQETINRPK